MTLRGSSAAQAASLLLATCCRRTSLGALRTILRAALRTLHDANRIKRAAHNVITHTRQILHTAAANQHNRVLLQVMTLARNVRGNLNAVRQANASDLAERRVRLLWRLCIDASANTTTLRRTLQRRRCRLIIRRRAPFSHELIKCRQSKLLTNPNPNQTQQATIHAHLQTAHTYAIRPARRLNYCFASALLQSQTRIKTVAARHSALKKIREQEKADSVSLIPAYIAFQGGGCRRHRCDSPIFVSQMGFTDLPSQLETVSGLFAGSICETLFRHNHSPRYIHTESRLTEPFKSIKHSDLSQQTPRRIHSFRVFLLRLLKITPKLHFRDEQTRVNHGKKSASRQKSDFQFTSKRHLPSATIPHYALSHLDHSSSLLCG
jgi:hypothetical protein